jgi:hypothetical protein
MVGKYEDANSLALALTQVWVEHYSSAVTKAGVKPLDLDSVLNAYNTSRNWVKSYIIKDAPESGARPARPAPPMPPPPPLPLSTT